MSTTALNDDRTRGYQSLEISRNDPVETEYKSVDGLSDLLFPGFGDEKNRKSTIMVAVFSLLNTILGGGILSLPYAFMKSGALLGVLMMSISVVISIFSLQLLCKMARKTGSKTYSDVMRKTMGVNTPEIVDVIMFLLLKLVLIAFCVLVKSISGDLAEFLFLENDQIFGAATRNKITSVIFIFFVLPLMTLEDLYSLRYASYVGMASITILTTVLVIKATAVPADTLVQEGRLFPAASQDVMTALPIMLIAYLCQFNAVEVFSVLRNPTEEAVNRVMSHTISFSGAIFCIFGLAGYFLAFDACSDNILNNFSPRDPSLVVARCGLVFTLICQLPMIGVPCRNLTFMIYGHIGRICQNRRSRSASIISREDMFRIGNHGSPSSTGSLFDSPLFGGNGSPGSSPLSGLFTRSNSDAVANSNSNASTYLAVEQAAQRSLSSGADVSAGAALLQAQVARTGRASHREQRMSLKGKQILNRQRSMSLAGVDPNDLDETPPTFTARAMCALMLVLTTLVVGEFVPGVAFIWTIAGSSVSLLLAFILPSAAYIMLWRIANEGDQEEGTGAGGQHFPGSSTHSGSSSDVKEKFQWQSCTFWKEMWVTDRDLVYSSILLVLSLLTAPICTYWSISHKSGG